MLATPACLWPALLHTRMHCGWRLSSEDHEQAGRDRPFLPFSRDFHVLHDCLLAHQAEGFDDCSKQAITLIVAPGELSRSSAKCRMKITSPEIGEQLQVLSGGPPAQSAQRLIAVGSNSSLRPRHHSGFAGLHTILSTHSSGTGAL